MTSNVMAVLDEAIREALGTRLYDALMDSGVARIRMHEMACLVAFSRNLQGGFVETLRTMWCELSRAGEYPSDVADAAPRVGG